MYLWANSLWYFLHYSTLFYKNNPKYNKYFASILNLLRYLIPCPTCKNHYNLMINSFSYNYFSNLFRYTVIIHNKVNNRLNKPLINFNQAYQLYNKSVDNTTIRLMLQEIYKYNRGKPYLYYLFLKNVIHTYPDKNIKHILVNRIKSIEATYPLLSTRVSRLHNITTIIISKYEQKIV